MNRRTMLKTVALAGVASAIPRAVFGFMPSKLEAPWTYLRSLAKSDGGFGWEDQEESHLTSTFAAIASHKLLKIPLRDQKRLAEFVRTHHPSQLKKMEQEHRIFDFQQIQSLVWLSEDISKFRDTVRAWKKPVAYLKQYEQHGYPVFQSEMAAIKCHALVGLKPDDLPAAFVEYLDSRRRDNGSFNNTPATDGGDGHILNTWWGLQALDFLGRSHEKKSETVAWLQACQRSSGGFTFAPKPEFGGVDDVAYTWAAVRALHLLGSEPRKRIACVNYLHSLANADGGFGDRPCWQSNPVANYYALDALKVLTDEPVDFRLELNLNFRESPVPAHFSVFSIQIEAPGQGSPSDAVELARKLRIHLWGAKNAKPEWLARAQAIADRRRLPVRFFVSNEEYGTWLKVPGLGTYSHTSDVIAPLGRNSGKALNQASVSWAEFRKQRLAQLQRARGRLVWQFGENEELVRMLLDDSVERGGFAAISTFHFGNPDFTNSEPFLHRWRGKIPFIALQDAHTSEAWWSCDLLAGFRTLFLATEPTWESWLEALKKNWVVAVRHDAASNFKTWMHSGSREVLDFVRARETDWKWWSDAKTIERPLATLAVLRPDDRFEVGAPSEGVALRLRCWWDCTVHGVLKRPLVELIRLTLDGKELKTSSVEKKNALGAITDHYHLAPLKQIDTGHHAVVVTLRRLNTGEEVHREFEVEI